MREQVDTVVIGGGQAGLAMSAVLLEHGREHLVLERRRVGERWRTERCDSLRFQFPNWSLRLPGDVYVGDDPDGFAHHSEIVRRIEAYAADIRPPIREHTDVVDLGDDGAGTGFVVSTAEGTTIRRTDGSVALTDHRPPRTPQPAGRGADRQGPTSDRARQATGPDKRQCPTATGPDSDRARKRRCPGPRKDRGTAVVPGDY